MTNRKGTLLVVLGLLVLALPLFASGETEAAVEQMATVHATGWPIVDEKITVEMMGSRAPNQADWNTFRIWEWYEEKTNIHVNWTTVDHDAREESKKLMFAAGDYPEALYGMYLTPQEEIVYGSQGVLLPLEDLYDKYAPNVAAYLDSDPTARKTYTAPDGHIYTFPSATDRTVFLNAYTMINVEWLKVLGLAMPETVDNFYEALKAFKTMDPNGNKKADEIPLSISIRPDTDDFWHLLQWFGITSDRKSRVYAEDDGTIIYVPTDPRTLEALKWFNKLWKEGLLDQETFTQTWREIDAKGQAKEAELLGAFKRSTIAWTVGFERFPHYEIMPALKNHLGTKIVTGAFQESKGRFSVTNKATNPAALVRWIDYFATLEGAMNIQYGPEGENWEWVNDTQWVPLQPNVQSTSESITPKNGTHVPFINFDKIVRTRFIKEGDIDWQAKVYAGIDAGLHPFRRVSFPDAYMSIEQVNASAPLQTDLNSYIDQMIARFIVGDEPFSNWDSYVATVNKMSVDKLLAVYQEVYDSYSQ